MTELRVTAEAYRADRIPAVFPEGKPGRDIALHQLFQVGHIPVVASFTRL